MSEACHHAPRVGGFFHPLGRAGRIALVALACVFLMVDCTRPPARGKPQRDERDLAREEAGDVLTSVPAAGDPVDGDYLIRSLNSEPATLNPLTAVDVASGTVTEWIHETLIQRNPKTLDYEPMLAKSWEVSSDHLSYTFHLREDVHWHDGQPFSADDVIYSFERIKDRAVDAAHLRVYYVDVDRYEKIDRYTVRCVYSKPYFLALDVCGTIPLVPRHVYAGAPDFNTHPANRAPVGTGPMKFARWETGRIIELEENPAYWGERKLHFRKLVFKVITDSAVALQVFKEGEIDMVGLTPEQWVRQVHSKRFRRRANRLVFDYPSYSYIGWNLRRAPFDDRRVREALTYLMPREELARTVYHGFARVICSPIFYLTPYYDRTLKCRPFDPAKARSLLEQAGWRDSDQDGWLDRRGEKFRFELLMTGNNAVGEQIATTYKEELARAGIDMAIRRLEWAAFLERVQQWAFDAAMLGWALSVDPDPYQLWHSSQADIKRSSNFIGFKNSEVDRLLELNRRTFDRTRRIELLREFQRIIFREVPYTFLFSSRALVAVDRRISNIHFYAPAPCYDLREWFVPADLQRYG